MEYYLERCGTVVAVFAGTKRYDPYADGRGGWVVDGACGVFARRDSPCCGSSVSVRYLKDECRKIDEERAREAHPQLFVYLGD